MNYSTLSESVLISKLIETQYTFNEISSLIFAVCRCPWRFLPEHNKFVFSLPLSLSLTPPSSCLQPTTHFPPSSCCLPPAIPSLSFRALVLLLFVPNRVARRPRCPTDRPRRLLYLYSGLRVLQGTYVPVSRSTRESAIHIPPFYRITYTQTANKRT